MSVTKSQPKTDRTNVNTMTQEGLRRLGAALLGTRLSMNRRGEIFDLERMAQNIETAMSFDSLPKAVQNDFLRNGISLDDLSEYIRTKTGGYFVAKQTLSRLENGSTEPKWNTIAILAASQLLRHPVTGVPYKPEDYFAIACERLDILTGEAIECNCATDTARS
jgi:transcriptional regulator with XRE-family HTH domain